MLSIIIPCYNAEQYIITTLSKFEEQTVSDFEIVIVEDCSTDNTVAVIQKFIENTKLNIKIVKNVKNCGPGESRRIGVCNSSGEYISFCDSDDWYENNFVEVMTKAIQDNCDMVMCNNYKVTANGKSIDDVVSKLEGRTRGDVVAYAPMSLCRLIIKRDLITQVSFNELYYSEDGVVFIQLLMKAKKIEYVKMPLYNYLLRTDSAHGKPSKKAYYDTLCAYDLIRNFWTLEYQDSLEYYIIKNILYSATLYGFKIQLKHEEIRNFINKVKADYPDYIKNKYFNDISLFKKIYIISLYYNCLFIPKMIAKLHGLLIRMR